MSYTEAALLTISDLCRQESFESCVCAMLGGFRQAEEVPEPPNHDAQGTSWAVLENFPCYLAVKVPSLNRAHSVRKLSPSQASPKAREETLRDHCEAHLKVENMGMIKYLFRLRKKWENSFATGVSRLDMQNLITSITGFPVSIRCRWYKFGKAPAPKGLTTERDSKGALADANATKLAVRLKEKSNCSVKVRFIVDTLQGSANGTAIQERIVLPRCHDLIFSTLNLWEDSYLPPPPPQPQPRPQGRGGGKGERGERPSGGPKASRTKNQENKKFCSAWNGRSVEEACPMTVIQTDSD